MKIAFIGTGVMGSHMALHLAKEHEVHVYNRTAEKAEKLSPPCIFHDKLGDWLGEMEVVITIVGYPKDVEEVTNTVLQYVKKGTIVIDMTTSSPKLAVELFEKGLKQGVDLLDAPVTGGDVGARNAALTIMVGGREEIFSKVEPLLNLMGKTIIYMGSAGNGQSMKLANQAAIAGTLAGVVESIVFGIEKGLDLNKLLNILTTGSASSFQAEKNGAHILNKNLDPGFYIKHFLKDLTLLIENSMIDLGIANKVKTMLEELVSKGYEDLGTQALILYYNNSFNN